MTSDNVKLRQSTSFWSHADDLDRINAVVGLLNLEAEDVLGYQDLDTELSDDWHKSL